jgi:predicted dehydrogenase
MSKAVNRREFFSQTAVGSVAAGLALSSAGHTEAKEKPKPTPPSDRINVGFVGVGARACQLIPAIQAVEGTEISAVCDAYTGRVVRARQDLDGRPKDYGDYRKIVGDPGIDVVVVATPDHHHKRHIIDALKAGKDVYVEKPLTYSVDEGVEIIEAAKQSGRICQVGSQGMSATIQRKAREIIQSGRLGKVTMIRASYNRNTPGGAWIYPIPPDASSETVDWAMFQGDAPETPFSLERFFRWRCYRDYSGGISTDLFVHLCTTIHFLMDAKVPNMVVGAGQLYRWKASRDVPDTINGILEYPEGFVVNLSSTFNNASAAGEGFQILGTEGTITLGGGMRIQREHPVDGNDWIVRSWPKELEEKYWQDPEVQKRELPATWDAATYASSEVIEADGPDSTQIHMQKFFDAVKTRKQPEQDASMGHHAASCAHMVNISAEKGAPVYWDYDRDTIKT